ncbi:MAG: hypothetical protein ACJ8F7_18205 [Gemmataceae bacterium]
MKARILLLAGLLFAIGVYQPRAAAEAPPMVAWKSRKIVIPIQLKPEKLSEVRELLLFVSTDEGRTWSQEARVTPDKHSFQFVAPADGRYLFTVCDVNLQGEKTPADLNQVPPGLIVDVDTKPPIVKLSATDRVGDEVVVVWHIEEENPDPSTLKLEYRPTNDSLSSWTPVPIIPGPDGQQKFRPSTPGPIMVRMSFQDKAGNQTQAMNVVAAGAMASTAGSSPIGPVATAPPPVVPAAAGPIVPINMDSGAAPPASPPRIEPPMTPIASSTPTPGLPPRDGFTSSHETVQPAVASNAPAPPAHPDMRSPQLINSTQIKLGYKVKSAGPSGVRRAMLYMTENDGQSWQEIGRDETATGQVTATLPGEGTFGFRIVLESYAGMSKGPPLPGDQPEIRVEVDLTAPHVELYAPAPDPNHRDTLILRWSASDKNLAGNPIDLEYAEKEDGEWHKIASPPNTGVYSWKLPPRMPVRVFLRVKACDLAGNIGEARTPTPQLIDLYKPEGELTNITGATMQLRP